MSLWKIAWRSIQQRALASSLTAVSMALGVALVVAVLVIYGVIYQSFHRGGEGYDLIVGAKGSPLQLVLNSVYYLQQPIENIPYGFYKELTEGRFAGDIEAAVPICMGHTYAGYRVVGTTPEMFERVKYQGGQSYEFAEGENFKQENHFEAVVGAIAAQKTGLTVGKTFQTIHGGEGGKAHEESFKVVGVLRPTGTPNDRALFVNMEGFYVIHGHEEEAEEAKEQGEQASQAAAAKPTEKKDLPAEKTDKTAKTDAAGAKKDAQHHHAHNDDRRITAVLVCTDQSRPQMTRLLAKQINEGSVAQAAVPSEVIAGLFEGIIGDVQMVLLVLAVLVVIVAGIGIMVSIYNSMSDRRHEIAIMRALGASRGTVMLVILLESILLSLGGGALGLLLGHGLTGLLGPLIVERTGVSVGLAQFRILELVLIPGLIALASVVGYLPAVAAYRTDVAKSLQ